MAKVNKSRGNGGKALAKKEYTLQIQEWGYSYCPQCNQIRYSSDMVATQNGVKCAVCGSYELESPEWVRCPYEKAAGAVKCPRGGRGIVEKVSGVECRYMCTYRMRS